jgi:CCR4-NOT transcription complex subunit 1
LLHRCLACVQSADSSARVRRESGGLQRKVVKDLDAGNRALPLTLLPLLGDVSIDQPGAGRCAPGATLYYPPLAHALSSWVFISNWFIFFTFVYFDDTVAVPVSWCLSDDRIVADQIIERPTTLVGSPHAPRSVVADAPLPRSLSPLPLYTKNPNRDFVMGDHNKIGGDIVSRLAASSGPSMVIEELGYGCAVSKEYFKEVVGLMPAIDERELARLVGVLARTHSSLDVPSSAMTLQSLAAAVGINPPSPQSMAAATWNYDNAVDALRELFPSLNWAAAMSYLDHDGFAVPDARAFEAIVRMFSRATKDKEPFPVSAVCTGSAWQRAPAGQLEFLRHAVVAAPEMFPWAFSRRKIAPVEGLAGGASPIGTPNHCWLSVDLYLTLAALAGGLVNGELAGKVRGVLEPAMQACAEVVALGASQAMVEDMTAGNGLLVEVTTAVLPPYLSATGHPNAALVLHRVWASGGAGQECVARAMAEMHAREGGANVPRLLDVCQDLKALSAVLDRAPHDFAVELAALAARREYLNLEKWLQERAAASGAPFAAACLRFLRSRATGPEDGGGAAPGAPKLAVETMAIFFKVLQAGAGGLPPDLREELRGVATAAANANPTLAAAVASAGGGGGGSGAVMPGGGGGVGGGGSGGLGAGGLGGGAGTAASQQGSGGGEAGGSGGGGNAGASGGGNFPADVEAEANSYFQRLYSGQHTVEQTVDMLTRFRGSQNGRERDIFGCMVGPLVQVQSSVTHSV